MRMRPKKNREKRMERVDSLFVNRKDDGFVDI